MEQIVYLSLDGKGTARRQIIIYLLALLLLASQTILNLVQKRPLAPLFATALLITVIAGIALWFQSSRSGVPRLVLTDNALLLKLTSFGKLRTITAAEIGRFTFHPARCDLFLKAGTGSAIPIAAQAYAENKRLLVLLKEFAAANRIPCTEAATASQTRRSSAPH